MADKQQNNKEFFIQWHLTDECDMRCKHCYIPHAMKRGELREGPTLTESKKLIDEFSELVSRWKIGGEINFSGGNPLLCKDFFNITSYAAKKRIKIGVLGNPTSVLDDVVVQMLKEVPVSTYQISVDGLKENHEIMRGRGSYDIAMQGIENLVRHGIRVVVLSTVTKQNYQDLPQLAEHLVKKGVFSYGFARLVPIGEGNKIAEETFTPLEYRSFMYQMHDTFQKLEKQYPKFSFIPKDPLWTLLYSEVEKQEHSHQCHNNLICGGCSIGVNGLSIDVDGTVYACRRLEVPIGNIKDHSLRDIFIKSPVLHEFRSYELIEGCGSCDLLSDCRGCRAVAYAVGGSYFSKDPQCWKMLERC